MQTTRAHVVLPLMVGEEEVVVVVMDGSGVMIGLTILLLHIPNNHHESVKLSHINLDSKELEDKAGDRAFGLVFWVVELLAILPDKGVTKEDGQVTKGTTWVALIEAPPTTMDGTTTLVRVHHPEVVDIQAPGLVVPVIDDIGVKQLTALLHPF